MMERSLHANTTQFPDILTDQVMPLVSGHEWKVIHYGVRYALGYRATETLTIAQIAFGRQKENGEWADRGTGLSEAEVQECLAYLCDVVHLFLREDRPRRPLGYRLNLDLSSIDWTALQGRTNATMPAPPAPEETAPPVRRARRGGRAAHVEQPATDMRLGVADERPLLDRLRQELRSDEQSTFDRLLALLQQKVQVELDDMVVWQLYKMWQTYGFRCLNNAFEATLVAASLDDINHSCLIATLSAMLERENFGQITPVFRDQLDDMARQWRDLTDWQDAISTAVKINRRRLKTVETILKNKTAPPVAGATGESANARPTAAAQGRKRSARRSSEYTEEELLAARAAERDQEWPKPID